MNISVETLNNKQAIELFDGLEGQFQIKIGNQTFLMCEHNGLLVIRSRNRSLWIHPVSANTIALEEPKFQSALDE